MLALTVSLLCLGALVAGEVSMTHTTVLLPCSEAGNGGTVQIEIGAEGGCFVWEAEDDTIVQMQPIVSEDSSCLAGEGNTRVLVSPSSLCSARPLTTSLTAKEIKTGHAVECEVIIAPIDRIEVMTQTDKVYLEERQRIQLQGFDRDGNVFSSLRGLFFEWSFPVRKVMSQAGFQDASVFADELYVKLEKQGYSSDMIVVRGNTPGKAAIVAQLRKNSKIKTNKDIYVVEALSLSPKLILTVPSNRFEVEVFVRSGKHAWISLGLPSPSYKLKSLDSAVATVFDNGTSFSHAKLGATSIAVYDTVCPFHEKASKVIVQHPTGLRLFVEPFRDAYAAGIWNKRILKNERQAKLPWRLTLGKKYVVDMELYHRKHGAFVVPGDAVYAATSSDEAIVSVVEVEGSKVWIQANAIGETALTSNIKYGKSSFFEAKKELIVDKPLQLEHTSEIHLPCGSAVGAGQTSEFNIKVADQGGSQVYSLISHDPEIIAVKDTPRRVLAQQCGETKVSVCDYRSVDNMATLDVIVSEPSLTQGSALIAADGTREGRVGSVFSTEFIVLSSDRKTYSNCSSLRARFELERSARDKFTFTVGSCDGNSMFPVEIKVEQQGYGRLRGRLDYDDRTDKYANMELIGFNAATIDRSTVIVAEGHAAIVTWEGGPLPSRDGASKITADAELPLHFKLKAKMNMQNREMRIICESARQHPDDVYLVLSNTESRSVPIPAVDVNHVVVLCVPPVRFTSPILSLPVGSTMEAALTIPEHPLFKQIQFYIEGDELVRLDTDTMARGVSLTGSSLGETLVHARVIHDAAASEDTESGLHSVVSVIVDFKDLRIAGVPSLGVLVGSSSNLFIESGTGVEPLDHNMKNLDIQWRITEGDGVSMSSLFRHETEEYHVGPSVHLVTHRPGRIRVRADISYVSLDQYSFFETKTVVLEETIKVLPRLELLCPLNLLLPLQSKYTVRTNKEMLRQMDDVSFQVFDYTRDQSLQIGSATGTEVVLESVNEGISSMMASMESVGIFVMVQSKQPSAIEISSHDGYIDHALQLCVDQETQPLFIYLIDNVGRRFSSALPLHGDRAHLEYVLSDPDALKVTSLLPQHDKDPELLDVLQLSALHPVGETVVIKLAAAKEWKVPPTFVSVSVRNDSYCSESNQVARVTFQLRDVTSILSRSEAERAQWESQLKLDLSSSLELDAGRISIDSVDVDAGRVDIEVVPSTTATDASPRAVFHAMELQLRDRSSGLRRGSISQLFDPKQALVATFLTYKHPPRPRAAWHERAVRGMTSWILSTLLSTGAALALLIGLFYLFGSSKQTKATRVRPAEPVSSPKRLPYQRVSDFRRTTPHRRFR